MDEGLDHIARIAHWILTLVVGALSKVRTQIRQRPQRRSVIGKSATRYDRSPLRLSVGVFAHAEKPVRRYSASRPADTPARNTCLFGLEYPAETHLAVDQASGRS